MNINNILAQQIKDLNPPIPFIQPSAAPTIMTGMQELCYNRGHEAAQASVDPSPIVDGLDAAPCTWSSTNHQAYTQGFIDGLGL